MSPRPAAGLALGAAVFWLLGLLYFREWIAHNDFAIFRIALERQLDGDLRVVGAYSRLAVFHPGPLREWVFVVPYWLSGRRASSLPATALVLNAGWVFWTIVVARRFASRATRLGCGVGLLALVIALGPNLASAWNPHLAIVPMYLACWSVVSAISYEGRSSIAAICGASFAAHMHASALLVGGGLLMAVLVVIVLRRRDDLRALIGAVAITLVLWSGPLVDLRRGRDSNLIRMLDAGADGESVGIGAALAHVSRLLWPATPLTRYAVRPTTELFDGFFRWWMLLAVAGLIVLSVLASRARSEVICAPPDELVSGGLPRLARRPEAVAPIVALGALALATVSVSLFVEPVYRYLYGPVQAVAVFALAVLFAGALLGVEAHSSNAVVAVSDRVAWVVVGAALAVFFISVPQDDHETVGRRALGVEEAVTVALDARPAWRVVEVVGLDLRAANIDAEVAEIAMRAGLDVRSARFGFGVPAPLGGEHLLVTAMGPGRDCLRRFPDEADEFLDGVIATTGDPVAIFALEPGSGADVTCLSDGRA